MQKRRGSAQHLTFFSQQGVSTNHFSGKKVLAHHKLPIWKNLLRVHHWKIPTTCLRNTLSEINNSHLKIDGWNTILSFLGLAYFQDLLVRLRKCNLWPPLGEKQLTPKIFTPMVAKIDVVAPHGEDSFFFPHGDAKKRGEKDWVGEFCPTKKKTKLQIEDGTVGRFAPFKKTCERL